MSGYEFDVFISYSRRGGNARKWVLNHFYPRLKDCLADELHPAPTVFLDKEMERGVHWPSRLEKAVLRSKILISVYAPPYFHSPWCMAEWESFRARERLLGLADVDLPQGLVYPVLFSDSASFPEEGRYRSWQDLKAYAVPDPGYQETKDWIEFHKRMVVLAADLAELLQQVPEWNPNWPVQRPDPPLPPPAPIPRFERCPEP